MQALKSAAHAAGYAMAAEDLPEPRPAAIQPARTGTAIVLRASRPASFKLLRAQRFLRRLWQRDWTAGHWPGRATA
jgi:hypothetical protein